MAKITIAIARPDDARELAPRLRAADKLEVQRSHGFETPLEALLYSMAVPGAQAFTARIDGRVEAMFGVSLATFFTRIGVPWFLGSAVVEDNKLAFVKLTRAFLQDCLLQYPRLVQYVDADYAKALAWARACGFEVFEPEPYGIDGALFCRVEMRRAVMQQDDLLLHNRRVS